MKEALLHQHTLLFVMSGLRLYKSSKSSLNWFENSPTWLTAAADGLKSHGGRSLPTLKLRQARSG
jgi:hypothetical protein